MEAGKETIEKIEQLVTDRLLVEVEGRKYTPTRLSPVMYVPRPDTIVVHNLRGFCGFISNDIDMRIIKDQSLIVVDSPKRVRLISAVAGDDLKREELIQAELDEGLEKFPFGKFLSQEEFAIRFRSLFVQKKGDDFEYVLSYASKLTGGTQIDGSDDGITQEVQVKRGLSGALKDKVALKPIVKLSPFRTFREVAQPQSEFLLRVRLDSNDVPTVALFEADGGDWINTATENIVQYIQSLVTDIPVIA
jgi:predicted transcriptional regulator